MLASVCLGDGLFLLLFDYALTGRPIVFYVPDLLHHQQIRGLYLDLEDVAPGQVVSAVDALAEVLQSLSTLRANFGLPLEGFRRRFGALEYGAAANRVWVVLGEAI